MGIQFVQYVRGASRSTNLIVESVFDTISVLTIIVRFLVQNIRYVFIFSAFFELYEFLVYHLNTTMTRSFENFFITNLISFD